MSSVCLSLVANLRCSGLLPQQAIGILIPPIVEALVVSLLIYTQRKKGRKHFLIIFDSYLYLCLCVVDFVSKFNDTIATSLSAFSLIDRIIGGLSGLPIFFYALFLYLFARRQLLPILHHRFKWGIKVLLTLLIPIILILVELGSLLGISYTVLVPSRELAIRFDSKAMKAISTLLNSAGLILLTLYQAIIFCLAIYRIFRHFYHNHGPSDDGRRGDTAPTAGLGGLGWMAAAIKLGAIEVLLGFIPDSFGMALPRRLVRLLARAFLTWAIYKGMNEVLMSTMFRVASFDSIEGLPPRRVPVNPPDIRRLISEPMSKTFVKMSPTASTFHSRKKVPDAMAEIGKFDASSVDEKSLSSDYGAARKPVKEVPQISVISEPVAQKVAPVTTATSPPPSPGSQKNGRRVTMAYDGRAAPMLDLRFSAQAFADAGLILKKIGKHSPSSSLDHSSSEDSGPRVSGLTRSTSTPPSAFMTRSRSRSTPPASRHPAPEDIPKVPSVSATQTKEPPMKQPLFVSEKVDRRGISQDSGQSKIKNPFADSSEVTSPPILGSLDSGFRGLVKGEESSGSTEESLEAIQRIPAISPSLPPGVVVAPSEETPSRRPPRRKPPPSLASQTSRPRSNSQPRLPSYAFASPDLEVHPIPQRSELSPRASLDQDVANRTRRRIRTHLESVSASNPIAVNGAQWASRPPNEPRSAGSSHSRSRALSGSNNFIATAESIPSLMFPSRANTLGRSGRNPRPYGFGRNAKDTTHSPTTVYTRESLDTFDDDDFHLPDDRPVGRIARRALGIEQFLEKEKALQSGQEETSSAQVGVIDPAVRQAGRRRPRSGVDANKRIPKQSTRRPSIPQPPIDRGPQPFESLPHKGEAMSIGDHVARAAFEAAWRTVESNSSSARFDSLKKVGSVKVLTTPEPTRHFRMFSEQSMRVDEGREEAIPQTEISRFGTGGRSRLDSA